jgi:hypothetical protein
MRLQTGISREIYLSLVIVTLISMCPILPLISLVYKLYYSLINALVDTAVPSEHERQSSASLNRDRSEDP